jgi:Na+-translocating ferredoxin:NAD+ oxidoreductase RnfC subunit
LRPLPRELTRLVLPLKQSAGSPVAPSVRAGQRVQKGDVLGEPASGALGATLHAPMAALVESVSETIVLVKA